MGTKVAVPAGTVFGSLKVLRELEPRRFPSGQAARMIECQCSCGAIVSVQLNNLRTGNSTVCQRCRQRKSVKHGWAGTPEYRSWKSMHRRCYNPKDSGYRNYGGRGCYVHERWHQDNPKGFENFLEDMGPRPSPQHTLDKDGIAHENLCYGPGLCRWATPKQQNRLRRGNQMIEFRGRRQCVTAWADELGLSKHRIRQRLKLGWTIERTLTTKVDARRKSKTEQAA